MKKDFALYLDAKSFGEESASFLINRRVLAYLEIAGSNVTIHEGYDGVQITSNIFQKLQRLLSYFLPLRFALR